MPATRAFFVQKFFLFPENVQLHITNNLSQQIYLLLK